MTAKAHQISSATFETIRTGRMSKDTSWACWAEAPGGGFTATSTHDMSILDPAQNPSLIGSLTSEFIFVGVNRGLPGEDKKRASKFRQLPGFDAPLGVFHCGRQDHWLAHALNDTPGWGGLMTDLFKGQDMATKTAAQCIKLADASQRAAAIEALKEQVQLLGGQTPTLVAFSKDIESMLTPHWPETKRVFHYSVWSPHAAKFGLTGSKEDYRKHVAQVLGW